MNINLIQIKIVKKVFVKVITFEEKIKLINDDAFKVMEKMIANNEKVDVIIYDPPYGILKNHPNDGLKKHNLDWDYF